MALVTVVIPAEDVIRDCGMGLVFKRVLFRYTNAVELEVSWNVDQRRHKINEKMWLPYSNHLFLLSNKQQNEPPSKAHRPSNLTLSDRISVLTTF